MCRISILAILDLWGISFHVVVVFSLGKILLYKSVLGHREQFLQKIKSEIARKLKKLKSWELFFS